MSALIRTLPASWYYDPAIYERERKGIFSKEWLYVAEEREFQKPRDFKVTEIAGFPLLLVVDENREIRAFHNFCRHRGAPLLTEGRGCLKASSLSCRYHGWTYDLKGALIQAPQWECPSLNGVDVSLLPIQVATLNGLVFINLDRSARPFAEFFGPIQKEIARSGYPMQEYETFSSMVKEGDFNWKVWVDGYQECYHCTTIHPIFNKDFQLRKYKVENKDGYAVHSCERKAQSEMGGFQGLWLWVSPNLGFPFYEPCYYTLQVNPLGPTRTRLSYSFRFRPSSSEESRNEFVEVIRRITMEDVAICEQVQKNLAAGVFEEGFLNPDRESGVEYFQNIVRRAVLSQAP